MTDDTLIMRQVHPSWVQGDTVSSLVFTSQTFRPTPKDEGLLSSYNERYFEPEQAFQHFTTEPPKLPSAGVVGVTRLECTSEELPVIEDNDPFEGHCSVDFNGLSKGRIKAKGGILRDYAVLRGTNGWLYKADN
jgi:hypothetical protein